jgi:hypothetical protein
MYLRSCGSFRSANHKKIGPANRKFAKCYICGRSANLTNYLSAQVCGCVIFLRNLFGDRGGFCRDNPNLLSKIPGRQ